jgi:hypothetical protein
LSKEQFLRVVRFVSFVNMKALNSCSIVLGVCWFILAGYVLSKFKHMRCEYISPCRTISRLNYRSLLDNALYYSRICRDAGSVRRQLLGLIWYWPIASSLVPTKKQNLWPKWGAFFITVCRCFLYHRSELNFLCI